MAWICIEKALRECVDFRNPHYSPGLIAKGGGYEKENH